ncbi:MAG: four helix bundle protein [Saprospiraceae bacterium]
MSHEEFNEGFRKRTKAFAVAVIKLCDELPPSRTTSVVVYQLCKASTSVGANFRAFCRGRSKNEKFSKICIVVEEADESLYWLEVIFESGKNTSQELKDLIQESTEILKIAAKIKVGFEP